MLRSNGDRSAVLAIAAIAAAVAMVAVTLALCLHSAEADSASEAVAEEKPVVRDRVGYHLVIEEYPGGSTWRQYDDGRVEYIIEGGN